MVIKNGWYITTLVICIGLLVATTRLMSTSEEYLSSDNMHTIDSFSTDESELRPSDLELTDKVFTFFAPDNTTERSHYLEKEYMYYIYIELVTPHNVSKMRIRIFDPEGKQYNVFESEMYYNPEQGRYFEIPFGAEMSGTHRFIFYSESNVNFNLYIRIEQGPLCLHDKIDSQYHDNLIYFEVTNFSDNQGISHKIKLETDVSYKFYIGRVTAISIKESNLIEMDYMIEDLSDEFNPIPFIIYNDEPLADIEDVSWFPFGTAHDGEYRIIIDINLISDSSEQPTKPHPDHVNIAYAIVEDYQISDIVDINNTKESDKESRSIDLLEELSSNSIFLPIEGTIAVILFAGGTAGTVYIIFIWQKKKANVSFPMGSKK